MKSVDRTEANKKKLKETSDLQKKTEETIWRIQHQVAETEEIGSATLDELRKQGKQIDDINEELDTVNSRLDKSKALQNKFDFWGGYWSGKNKSQASKEAADEMALRKKLDVSKIKEVFEVQKYDSFGRKWKRSYLVLCSDTSVQCNSLFDPYAQERMQKSKWTVDYSLPSIDSSGWTYGYDSSSLNKGQCDASPKWNSYVRRRKWRYNERSSSDHTHIDEIKDRNDARKSHFNKDKNEKAYIARKKNENYLSPFGNNNYNGSSSENQELDEESAAHLADVNRKDKKIDQDIDQIGHSIDRIGKISGSMRDEAIAQNSKLEAMDNKMHKVTEKQLYVNARQKKYLN